MRAPLLGVLLAASLHAAHGGELAWPIDCTVGKDCTLGYPDPDRDGRAFNCKAPGYKGHEGTDIVISREKMDQGTDVYAAANGMVLWVFDGKYDGCPDRRNPDCATPSRPLAPGSRDGHTVCTDLGPYCRGGHGNCFWCFAGGNVVVIKHENVPGVFATRYDHLKRNSIRVRPGQRVSQGEVIAQAGSAGRSSAPHLHFEVWGRDFYDPVDPWAGPCGTNKDAAMWKHPEQPWRRP